MKEVLQTLLKREYRHLRKLQSEAAESAETLEQMVRRITRAYLGYIEERGLILDRLAAEPSVADHGDPTEYNRDQAVEYVAQLFCDNFDMDMEIASLVVDISYGMPAAAGHLLTRKDVSRQTVEDITVAMLLGSYDAIKQKYSTSLKPLKKRVPW